MSLYTPCFHGNEFSTSQSIVLVLTVIHNSLSNYMWSLFNMKCCSITDHTLRGEGFRWCWWHCGFGGILPIYQIIHIRKVEENYVLILSKQTVFLYLWFYFLRLTTALSSAGWSDCRWENNKRTWWVRTHAGYLRLFIIISYFSAPFMLLYTKNAFWYSKQRMSFVQKV